ncbi:hypothetical protein K0U07_01065 [bacterium]|nr:hypothetical protein [bacterium]
MHKIFFLTLLLFFGTLSSYNINNHTNHEITLSITTKNDNLKDLEANKITIPAKESMHKDTDYECSFFGLHLLDVEGTTYHIKDNEYWGREMINTYFQEDIYANAITVDIYPDKKPSTKCKIVITGNNNSIFLKQALKALP